MKAWVRNSSRRARSCQETGSTAALMTAEASLSEGRWGAGTDDLTRLPSDVAEAVWELTGEIISLTGSEHARRAAHGELDAPVDHHARFLTAMRQHLLAGGSSGRIALVEYGELPPRPLGGDHAQRHLGIAELYQLIGAEEGLWRIAQVEGEELRERHRHPVQHLLQ